jgi:hypothetical protein
MAYQEMTRSHQIPKITGIAHEPMPSLINIGLPRQNKFMTLPADPVNDIGAAITTLDRLLLIALASRLKSSWCKPLMKNQ